MKTITVRRTTHADLEAVTDAAIEFGLESDNAQFMAPDKYRKLIGSYIGVPFVASFVAVTDDGEIAGYIHIYAQDDWTTCLMGDLYQFYVRAKYRGTEAARLLRDAADEQFADWGCVRAYLCADTGFQDGGLGLKKFANLWGKNGFETTGISMKKEYV